MTMPQEIILISAFAVIAPVGLFLLFQVIGDGALRSECVRRHSRMARAVNSQPKAIGNADQCSVEVCTFQCYDLGLYAYGQCPSRFVAVREGRRLCPFHLREHEYRVAAEAEALAYAAQISEKEKTPR